MQINLLVIHTNSLGVRRQLISPTIAAFKDVVSSTSFIMKPDPGELPKDIESRVKYEMPPGVHPDDPEFTRALQPLSQEQLSNLLKHEQAWEQAAKAASPDHMTMVMEDDAYILPDGPKNLADLKVKGFSGAGAAAFDLMLFGLSSPQAAPGDLQQLHNVMPIFKIIPNKEAYLVTPAGARILLDNMKTIRFGCRYYLSWLSASGNLKVQYPTFRVTADASKLGIVPSSINTSNLLILNQEYMDMWQMLMGEGNGGGTIDLKKATEHYKKLEHIQSGDVMHLYGVILYRCGQKKEGRDLLMRAVEQLRKKGGLVNARSDVLNNTIQIFQNDQEDLAELSGRASRYSAP